MMSRLYVTNLAQSASLASLRQRFAACGEVVGVEILPERGAYQSTSSAYVSMSTQAAAERAATSLHGTVLHGRALVISHAPEPEARGRKRESTKEEEPTAARITQQYRERLAMIYDLSCHGSPLTVRMCFPEAETPSIWRVEARSGQGEAVVSATGASRELALRAVAESWSTPELDWVAIAGALKTVRAI
jgi:RNA recognition motif-containing protein